MIEKQSYYVGQYLITPHPQAPHFATVEQGALYLPQVVSELLSKSGTNSEGYRLIKELSLVSLFFFVNGILKSSGIYDGLDDSLSLDMMNFRQSTKCERDGATAAVFMPRGFSKSRVFTHGGLTWDLLRNPGESSVIVNAIYDKALEFLHIVQRNFDSNEMMGYFFPEYVPGARGGQVTDKILILPNKPQKGEVNCKVYGLTGAAEGGHFDIIQLDDLVGLDTLDQNRQSTALMGTARKWFNTNRRALRKTTASRVILAATRYALDDCYADVYSNCKTVTGWTKGDLQPQEKGEWDVYYRLVEEDGLYLRPNVMDEKGLTELMETDYWAAMTQYYNSPMKAGLAEFAECEIKPCSLIEDENKRLWIKRNDPNLLDDDKEMAVALGSCNVMCATDLAATDTNMNAKTCRTAVTVWAVDGHERKYLLWSRVGFFSIFESINYIFEANRVFKGYLIGTLVEMNAFQKIMKPWLEREQEQRGVYINPIGVNATGDKKARIRSAFGIGFARGQIYSVKEAVKPLLEETKQFPMNDSRLDTMDASEKAFVYCGRPETEEEKEVRLYEEEVEDIGHGLECTGY
jgi:hypothetical protein